MNKRTLNGNKEERREEGHVDTGLSIWAYGYEVDIGSEVKLGSKVRNIERGGEKRKTKRRRPGVKKQNETTRYETKRRNKRTKQIEKEYFVNEKIRDDQGKRRGEERKGDPYI